MTQKKLRFEDLQPHVDMLCDALENKGASSSGIPYNQEVYVQAKLFRNLLEKVRSQQISGYELEMCLQTFANETIAIIGTNQKNRIAKIVIALSFYIRKEYNKYNSSQS